MPSVGKLLTSFVAVLNHAGLVELYFAQLSERHRPSEIVSRTSHTSAGICEFSRGLALEEETAPTLKIST